MADSHNRTYLLAGFFEPMLFLFDHEDPEASGVLTVKYRLPYSEPESLEGEARRRWMESHRAAEFDPAIWQQRT